MRLRRGQRVARDNNIGALLQYIRTGDVVAEHANHLLWRKSEVVAALFSGPVVHLPDVKALLSTWTGLSPDLHTLFIT